MFTSINLHKCNEAITKSNSPTPLDMKPNYFVDKAKVFPYTDAQTGTFNGVGANDLTMV